ncbi:MAG: hypothetical protein IJ875_02740 [Solobacterium sp.]|nr:hypothetical protein [Solobacterium sp.]
MFIIWIALVVVGISLSQARQTKKPIKKNLHPLPIEPKLPHVDKINGPAHTTIQHELPEEGYVILNGIKRKLDDCKYL